MKKLLLSVALLVTAATAALAQAQGPTVSQLPLPVPDRASPDDVQSYSRTLTGRVAEVAGNAITVRWSDGTRSKYIVSDKTRLRADRGTALAGRKDLTLADYQSGQAVSVTLRNSDRQVLEVRLRRAKD